MSALPPDIRKRFVQLLQEEEIDVYVLSLYCLHSTDLEFFKEADRARVRAIFDALREDTRRHAELLRLIIDMGGA